MNWSEIERLARDSNLDLDALREVALPAIAFAPGSETDGPATSGSYFGGLPMLPDGMPWPNWSPTRYCRAERETARRYIAQQPSTSPHWTAEIARLDELEARGSMALMFLAQLDLDQLARVAPVAPLPSTGKLLVFAEFQLGAASLGRADPVPPWCLVWFPNELSRTCAEPPTTAEGFVRQRHFMTPRPVFSFPDTVIRDGIVVYEQYGDDDGYETFLSALDTMGVRGRNQVGGHPLRLQDCDMPATVNRRHDGYDPWNPPPNDAAPRLAAGAAQWKFLFQITEDYSDFGWSGVASFWGRPHAIAAGNFGEAELHYEDT